MTQYLGTCMVIVVTGLVIAILARLVTGGILDEIERIRTRRFEKRWIIMSKMIGECTEYVGKFIGYTKEAIEIDERLGKDGKKYADEALEKTKRDYAKDHGIKL